MSNNFIVRNLGKVPYEITMREMQNFTKQRTADTEDECWICEHPPVFTLGQSMAGEAEVPKQIKNIPIVQSDRGGKITYHGPGQIVVYLMIDLRAKSMSVRTLIENSEQAIIKLCESYGITAHTMDDNKTSKMPGVYIGNKKVSSLGYRIKRGCSYHGISINHSMDLRPFSWIDVCGYPKLEVTQLKDHNIDVPAAELIQALVVMICQSFNFSPPGDIITNK